MTASLRDIIITHSQRQTQSCRVQIKYLILWLPITKYVPDEFSSLYRRNENSDFPHDEQ